MLTGLRKQIMGNSESFAPSPSTQNGHIVIKRSLPVALKKMRE